MSSSIASQASLCVLGPPPYSSSVFAYTKTKTAMKIIKVHTSRYPCSSSCMTLLAPGVPFFIYKSKTSTHLNRPGATVTRGTDMIRVWVLAIMVFSGICFASHITLALFLLYAILSSHVSPKNKTPVAFFLFVAGASVVVHMHAVFLSGPALMLVQQQTASDACKVQEVATAERLSQGSSACQSSDYKSESVSLFSRLRREDNVKSGRLYHVNQDSAVLASCREAGLQCFDFETFTSDGRRTIAPPFSAITNIRVQNARKVFAVPVPRLPLPSTLSLNVAGLATHHLPGDFVLSYAEEGYIGSDGVLSLAGHRHGIPYLWMIHSFLAIPADPSKDVQMSIEIAKTCGAEDECPSEPSVSEIIFSLTKGARVPSYTIFSQLLGCTYDFATDCEEDAVFGLLATTSNILAAVAMIVSIAFKIDSRKGPRLVSFALSGFDVVSLNLITFSRRLLFKYANTSTNICMFCLDFLQLCFAVNVLFQFQFGGDEKFLFENTAVSSIQYVLFPFLLLQGNVLLTSASVVAVTSAAAIWSDVAVWIGGLWGRGSPVG